MRKAVVFIKYFVLFILLVVMPMTYHPYVMGLTHALGFERGSVLSRYILSLFAILLMLSVVSTPSFKSRLSFRYLIYIVLTTITAIAIYAFWSNDLMFEDLRSILIVFAAILIGRSLHPTRTQMMVIMSLFSFAVLFAAFMQVRINIGGFRIEEQYLVDGKNRLGAMLASSSVSLLLLYYDKKDGINHKLALNIFYLACFAISIVLIVTIRARAALLAIIVMLVLIIYLTKRKYFLLYMAILVPVVVLLLYFMPDYILNYVSDSISAGTQRRGLFSGRTETYKAAIQVIRNNPFLSDVKNNLPDIGWVHNYPLLKLYNYGLLFSWPLLGLYIYSFVHSLKESVANKIDDCFAGGYTILIVPFMISLLEPTFPFGPGTVTVFNYILLGIADAYYSEKH